MDAAQLEERVIAWLGVKAGTPDTVHAATVAPAVFEWVDSLPSIRRTAADPAVWTKGTELGAVMLAARLVRRRNSPNGIEAFTADATAYVSREDPDVSRMLRLGPHKPPQVG